MMAASGTIWDLGVHSAWWKARGSAFSADASLVHCDPKQATSLVSPFVKGGDNNSAYCLGLPRSKEMFASVLYRCKIFIKILDKEVTPPMSFGKSL